MSHVCRTSTHAHIYLCGTSSVGPDSVFHDAPVEMGGATVVQTPEKKKICIPEKQRKFPTNIRSDPREPHPPSAYHHRRGTLCHPPTDSRHTKKGERGGPCSDHEDLHTVWKDAFLRCVVSTRLEKSRFYNLKKERQTHIETPPYISARDRKSCCARCALLLRGCSKHLLR